MCFTYSYQIIKDYFFKIINIFHAICRDKALTYFKFFDGFTAFPFLEYI